MKLISTSNNPLRSDLESASPASNSSKAPIKGQAAAAGTAPAPQSWAPDWSYDSNTMAYSARTESLYMKYTSKDGDVLELKAESSEISYASESIRYRATARALGRGPEADKGGPSLSDSALADGGVAAAEDPKAKQLADLREWAKGVERELRQQQHELLERILKQSGRHVDSGDGKFLVLYTSTSEKTVDGKQTAPAEEEAQVPPYWNAENTSDRIVHFATQMAKISGLDLKEFAAKIKDAISAGFDQAKEATGELQGPAAKLNKDTRDLVFSKLSKWLEEQAA